MKDKKTEIICQTRKIVWCGVCLALFWWLFESATHVFVFHQGDLITQILRPKPHELWMRTVVVVLLIGFAFYARSVVIQRYKAEEKTRSAYAELNQIFNTAADGMRVIDKDFNMLKYNQTFLKMIGVSEEEILGKKCYQVFPGPDCHTPECPLNKIMAGEKRVECDTLKRRQDGVEIPCIVTATPFRGPNGDLIGIVEDFKDITARKHAEERLQKANEELNDFVRIVSHDLKTPIFIIQGFSSRLYKKYKDRLDEKGLDYLKRIMSSARRMELLVLDLLSLSRSGHVIYSFKNISSCEIVGEIISNFQGKIREKGIEVIVSPDLPDICGDRDRLYRVFENLIVNAIKYMGDTQKPRIEIGYDDLGDSHQFFVRDNGIGIDPKYHKKIFEIFKRIDESPEDKGTGLGLTIVEKVVLAHGGKVWVESERGKGATFYFILPKEIQCGERPRQD